VLYYLSEWAIRLGMLAVVPLRRTAPAATAWLLLSFLFPWPGWLLYLVIGWPKMPAWRRDQVSRFLEAMQPTVKRLALSPSVTSPEVPAAFTQAVHLATRLGRLPIVGGNQAEILADYQAAIDHLVADIDAAEVYVHLLYYIFADDGTTNRVIEALGRAARRGVRCRVLMDAVGSKRALKKLAPRLQAIGVQAVAALPVGLFRRNRIRYDLRNHRKIAVVDGRTGYTGSQNLVDPSFKPGIVYEELVVRLHGPVVLELGFVFAADWYLETGELLGDVAYFPNPEIAGALVAQVLPSGPTFELENTQRLIVSLIHGARQRVVITTPYFIPDEALLQAVQTAVLRGVEVHLVVSKVKDQLLVGLAQESYYEQLLDAGAHIHRYHAAFLHAKHVSIDDEIAIIGSSNIDTRSFMLNAEVSLVAYNRELALKLRAEQERYFKHAERLTAEAWRQRSRFVSLGQNIARLVSPLL
jgi:cardiolipin synthase